MVNKTGSSDDLISIVGETSQWKGSHNTVLNAILGDVTSAKGRQNRSNKIGLYMEREESDV